MKFGSGSRKRIFYLVLGVVSYLASAAYLHFAAGVPFGDLLPALLVIGCGLSLFVWLMVYKIDPGEFKRPVRWEWIWLFLLIGWITLYITFGGSLIDRIFPPSWKNDERIYSLIVLGRKLFVFVLIPLLVYRRLGFTATDFGFRRPRTAFFSGKGMTLFAIASLIAINFQLVFSRAGGEILNTHFSWMQWVAGLPLATAWLCLEAGLVEEFFYRVILQSRITALIKSETGGIVITALIFGLSHAPGLYLRSASSEGITDTLPFIFYCAFTIAYMSMAGIFLGLAWSRTRNIWLVIAIHAIVDLLPYFSAFIHTWKL